MHNLLNKLRNKSNYYFPLDSYRGEKITDLPWIRLFIPFAPYSALLLCGVIFLWGILGHPNKPFLGREWDHVLKREETIARIWRFEKQVSTNHYTLSGFQDTLRWPD